jgi:Ca2+/H+ antiporter
LQRYFTGIHLNVNSSSNDISFPKSDAIVAIAAAAFIVNTIARNGEATWFEGAMLISVYVILGTAFFVTV